MVFFAFVMFVDKFVDRGLLRNPSKDLRLQVFLRSGVNNEGDKVVDGRLLWLLGGDDKAKADAPDHFLYGEGSLT